MIVGADLVVDTVRAIDRGDVRVQRQDDSRATAAPKVFAENACVDWDRPAEHVHNHIRGYSPSPGAWTVHGETRLKLLRSRIASASGEPGSVLQAKGRLVIGCGTGSVEIVELQQQGKRALSGADFLRGYQIATGDHLTCPPGG
jgi:methionyl-tRNA formyltransferase